MLHDLFFAVIFMSYAIGWWMLSTFFYWDFRDVGVKKGLINFCKRNFYLNTLLAILFFPSILIGLLSLRIEKWLVS